MSVGRICSREVDVVEPEETIEQAAQRMRQRDVGTLVVLDAERAPIGMLTDRDLVVRVLAPGKNPRSTYVGDVMTRQPQTVGDGTPIETALVEMASAACRRLPVVDREGRLVGVLSLDDVLALLAEESALIGRLLGRQLV